MEAASLAALLWLRERVDSSRYQRISFNCYHWFAPFIPAPDLATTVLGIRFRSPIGAAAGLDPQARHINTLERLGFGFMELGSVTMDREPRDLPAVQIDYEKRSVKRVVQDGTCSGFQLCRNVIRDQPEVPIGVNLQPGSDILIAAPYLANKEYTNLLEVTYPYADYIVANIASDHITDLSMYREEIHLRKLCRDLIQARDIEIGLQCAALLSVQGIQVPRARRLVPPLFLKIDTEWTNVQMLVKVLVEEGVDGVVVAGTNKAGEGGTAVAEASLKLLKEVRKTAGDQLVLIAAGGIFSAEDIVERLKSGASLVEIYSAFWLEGPYVVRRLSEGLSELLRPDGLSSVQTAA